MVKRSTNMEKPNEIWSKSSASKEHHNLTEKDKNKQLQSTKNYNKTRNELVKKHPLLVTTQSSKIGYTYSKEG